MGFMDEYNKALAEEKKKKKKESAKKETSSFMQAYRSSLADMEQVEDTPVVTTTRSTKKDDDERTWFQKGVFEDGYQFGDVTKAILGTTTDVLENVGSGVIGMGEAVADFATQLGAWGYGGLTPVQTEGLFGAPTTVYTFSAEDREKAKKEAKEFIAKDLYDEEEIAKKIISNPVKSLTGVDADADSVLGEKSDSLVQSGGQLLATAGLQAVGVPWFLTTGMTSYGSELENAYKQDATFEEAGLSAAVSAGAEILTEKLSGGIKFGGKALDDVLTKRIASGISNKLGRSLAKIGMDMVGEGSEEILSQVASNLGSKLYKEENLGELLFSEEAIDGYIESFVGGAVLGGVSGGINTVKSNRSGVDVVTGLNTNEQAVFDKVYKDRLAEAEENGKLSKKEKNKLYDQVMNDLEKGYISTDDIESVLSGDSYNSWKQHSDMENQYKQKIEELENMPNAEITVKQSEQLKSLREALAKHQEQYDTKNFKSILSEKTMGLVEGSRLAESYNERARRGQAFEADLSKYGEAQKAVIQKAIDSGILNNTNRTHEFVDIVSKISADKGVLFDFTNNEKLKESGFAVDGKQVNGFVTKDGVTLNIDSPKAWQSTVGHEITHVLEDTEMYDALKNTIFEYAKSKGEYDNRLASLTETYNGVEADIESELAADLVGDYLFQDADFINHLSTANRNVFQKIYDEIKYLYKVVTAGSKEARELEKVKRAFDKAYKESANAQTDTKYSLSDSDGRQLTKEQQDFFKDSKVRDENGNLKVMYHGSQNAGFHVFDPKHSDDEISLFFVDRNDVATSYSGSSEVYEARTIRTAEDMNNFLAEIGYDHYEAVEKDGKYELLEDGEHVAYSDTAKGIYEEFCWYESIGEGDANYKVYLNLTNPLVVDAQGRNWNNISREFSQEIYDRYKSLTDAEKNALSELAEWGEYSIFSDELLAVAETEREGWTLDSASAILVSAYKKLGGANANLYDAFSIASDNFSEDALREYSMKQMKTRDYAKKAKAEGYDGVIFNNIVDIGGHGGDYTPATVAIAFDSNQIKSTANEAPTKDADIRYSLSDDEYLDAVNRGDTETAQRMVSEFAKNAMPESKLRDENGNLRVVYHGTNTGDFTVFNPDYIGMSSGDDGFFGMGFYFAYTKGEASYYGAERVIPAYLNLKNPFNFDRELQTYKGKQARSGHAPDAVALMNFADKFPDIARNITVGVVEKGNNEVKDISLAEFSKAFKDVIDNKTFEYHEMTNDYGEKETLVTADVETHEYEYNGKKHSYRDYGFQKRFYGTPNDLDVAFEYLANSVYEYVDIPNRTQLILDNNREFTEALKNMGYDGAIQSEYGDEAVAFESSQIKSAEPVTYDDSDNPIPLSERFNPKNDDIRYSLSELDNAYQTNIKNKDMLGAEMAVERAANIAMPDSKIRDKNGNLIPVYHGTKAMFYEFDTSVSGGLNGTAEGYGIYTTDNPEIVKSYGDRHIKMYANITKPATSTKKTITVAKLTALIKDTCKREAQQMVDDGEYDNVKDALMDTWVSNYVYTYDLGMERSYRETANTIYRMSESDMDVIQEVMASMAIRDYAKATEFYRNSLIPVTGFDGYMTQWTDPETGKKSNIILAFNSNQLKSADAVTYDDGGNVIPLSERFNPDKADIRYSLSDEGEQFNEYGRWNLHNRYATPATDLRLDIAPTIEESSVVAPEPITHNEERIASQPNTEPPSDAPRAETMTAKEHKEAQLEAVQKELAEDRRLRDDAHNDYNQEIARLQAEYDAKKNKNTKVANDILRRIERVKRIRDSVDADYAKRIGSLERKEKLVREGKPTSRQEYHKRIMNNIKAVFQERGFDLDNVLKKAKNLSTFSTVDNTPQRVMEKALGYKEGQVLSDITVNKVAQNETSGIKWLNSFTDRKNGVLAKISKQYNIKPGSKESAAAQMYAEGFYVDENNEIIQYGDTELAMDFPDIVKQAQIKGLARDSRIRQIYDETLNAINESRTRNAYPEIPRLDNYFLHFRAMEDTFSRLGLPFNPNDIRAKDLPTDLNGVTADLKPGQPYFASAKHRTGKRTSFDLLGGLERYLSSAKNQIYHIDDIQTLRALRNYIADNYGQAKGLESLDSMTEDEAQERIKEVYGSHLSTFAKFLNEEANVLAGKTALIDRGIEGIIGRRGITFLDTINKQVGSNMVGYNISSSLTNFLPVVQTFAKGNKAAFVKAFAQTVAHKVSGQSDGFVENSPVMIRRQGADRFYRTPWQKISDPGYAFMGAVDSISTELIARTKYNELVSKGMDSEQAHYETDKWVSRLMGDRSLGQMPQLYNSKMLGLVTKFQLEVRNQLDSQFYDTIQEAKVSNEHIQNEQARNAKTAAKVASTFVQLAVVQHLFGKAFESVAGYNPAFDIIEVLLTAFGFDDDEESEDTVGDNLEQALLAFAEDMPYASTFLDGGRIPISAALPIKEIVKGEDEWGNEKSRWETIGEIAPYYVLPGGYGQVKKTYKGLDMFSDDHPIAGSYTDSGNLRFPVEDTLGNRIKAGIFGQYANENARDYFDNERSSLKEKQIQEFIDVEMPIRDYWDYRQELNKQETLEDKFDYIAGLDLPVEKKNILINNIVDRKEDVNLENYDDFSNYEEFDFYSKNTEKYNFLQSYGVSYEEYMSDEETKEKYDSDYSWYKNNPEKVTVSKAVTDNVLEYRTYTKALYDIRADKDENGDSIRGTAKTKKADYINSLDIDYGAKLILFKYEYNADDSYNNEIIDYLNGREDISYEEMETILKELGFEVDSKGNISW